MAVDTACLASGDFAIEDNFGNSKWHSGAAFEVVARLSPAVTIRFRIRQSVELQSETRSGTLLMIKHPYPIYS